MTGPDVHLESWDDARLQAAFSARAARAAPTPIGLADAARAAIGSDVAPEGRRIGFLAAAAAGVAVLVLGGVAILATIDHGPPAADQATERATTSVAGLGEPINVSAALAIRTDHPDDRELVVAGFLSTHGFISCDTNEAFGNPARVGCPAEFEWLTERPEILWKTTGTVTIGSLPTGPAFHSSLVLTGPPVRSNAPAERYEPVPVVLVGHFHDRRAALCSADEVSACGETFVVDRVAAVDGERRGVETVLRNERWDEATQKFVTEQPVALQDDVDRLVLVAAPGSTILSRLLLIGAEVASVEPVLAGDAAITQARLVWIVTAVDATEGRARPRTFVLVDGAPTLAEMTATGLAPIRPIDRSAPAPSATSGPGSSAAVLPTALLAHPIDVATAIAKRDHDLDNGELVVAGWARGPAVPLSCPMIRPGMPVALQCPNTFTWISDTRPDTLPDGELTRPPGPAMNLLVTPETNMQVSIFTLAAVRVVAIGQFDDPRATSCEPDSVQTCRRNFVVDAILDPSATRLDPRLDPARVGDDVRPVATWDQVVEAARRSSRGPAAILSVVAVRGSTVVSLVPVAASTPEVTSAPVVWVVRSVIGLDWSRPILETPLVVDGSPDSLLDRLYSATSNELVREIVIVN
jgi:hypothetical protein